MIEKPKPRQRADYSTLEVEAQQANLSPSHFAILMAASASDYAGVMATLSIGSLGTVKSRLNRARHAMAALLAAKESGDAVGR